MSTVKVEFDPSFFQKAANLLQNESRTMLYEIASLMQDNIRTNLLRKGIKDSGNLIKSYQRQVSYSNRRGVAVVGSNALYALPMEYGIKKRFFPPKTMIEAMTGWVKRKLGLSGKEGRRRAAAIAFKIGRKGLDPKRFPSYAVAEAFDAGAKRTAFIIERHVRRAFGLMERFR